MKICNGMILGLLVSTLTYGMEKKEENKPQNKQQQKQEYSRAAAMQLEVYKNERDSIQNDSDLSPRSKMAATIEIDTAIKDLHMKTNMNSNPERK